MKFGYTKLSIIPVRAEAKEQSEMVTQLLFGDIFSVLVEKKKWLQIQIESDGYEGWIDKSMFFEISQATFEQFKQSKPTVSDKLVSFLESKNEKIHLVKGSSFHFMENSQIIIGGQSFSVSHFSPVVSGGIQSLSENSRDLYALAISFSTSRIRILHLLIELYKISGKPKNIRHIFIQSRLRHS